MPYSRMLAWGIALGIFVAIPLGGTADEAVPRPRSAVREVAFSPDGRLLAAAASDLFTDGILAVWDVGTLQPCFTHREVVGFPRLAFSPEGSPLALARFATEAIARFGLRAESQLREAVRSESPEVRWRARKLRERISGGEADIKLLGHRESLECLCFSPDGRWLASGDQGGQIKLWNTIDWSEAASLSMPR